MKQEDQKQRTYADQLAQSRHQGRDDRAAAPRSVAEHGDQSYADSSAPSPDALHYEKLAILFQARLEAVASFCAEPAGKSEYQCMTVNS